MSDWLDDPDEDPFGGAYDNAAGHDPNPDEHADWATPSDDDDQLQREDLDWSSVGVDDADTDDDAHRDDGDDSEADGSAPDDYSLAGGNDGTFTNDTDSDLEVTDPPQDDDEPVLAEADDDRFGGDQSSEQDAWAEALGFAAVDPAGLPVDHSSSWEADSDWLDNLPDADWVGDVDVDTENWVDLTAFDADAASGGEIVADDPSAQDADGAVRGLWERLMGDADLPLTGSGTADLQGALDQLESVGGDALGSVITATRQLLGPA